MKCFLCQISVETERYRFSDGYRILVCPHCGTGLLSPQPLAEKVFQTYAGDYFSAGGEQGYAETAYFSQELALRRTFRALLQKMPPFSPTTSSLLDVGCAFGFLLDEARGKFAQRCGVEPSPSGRARASRVSDRVFTSVAEVPRRSFDCVTALHVLEHVPDPIGFLRELASVLKPGGVVVVGVPNFGSFWRLWMGRHWPSFKVPEHLFHFTQHSLMESLSAGGLRNVRPVAFPTYFTVGSVFAKLGLSKPVFGAARLLPLPQTCVAALGEVA